MNAACNVRLAAFPADATAPPLRRAASLASHAVFRAALHVMRHQGIRMPMAHPMLGFEPIHQLHVLLLALLFEQVEPVRDRMAILLLDRREIRCRAFRVQFAHGLLLYGERLIKRRLAWPS